MQGPRLGIRFKVSTLTCTTKHVLCYVLGTRLCGFRHVTVSESKFHGYMDFDYYNDRERSHQICCSDIAYCKVVKIYKVPS